MCCFWILVKLQRSLFVLALCKIVSINWVRGLPIVTASYDKKGASETKEQSRF